MREQEKYKQMMNEIHVSETTLRKVMEMDMSKKSMNKRGTMKKMGMAAAALLLCLVASNGICYAATGHSLATNVKVYINGEEVEADDVDVVENEDGTVTVTTEIDTSDDGSGSEVSSVIASDVISEDVEALIEEQGMNTINGRVIEKDGKQYFKYNGGEVDITEDLADGKASGTITDSDAEYHYEVTEKDGEYNVNVSEVK